MNRIKTTLTLTVLFAISIVAYGAGRKTGNTYFLGVAKSFQDSITYMTDVAGLSGIAYDKKTGSPLNIEMYTEQLSKYMAGEGRRGYICTTYTARDRKHIEKLYLKLKKRITKERGMRIMPLTPSEFSYQAVDPNTIYRNASEAGTTPSNATSTENQ